MGTFYYLTRRPRRSVWGLSTHSCATEEEAEELLTRLLKSSVTVAHAHYDEAERNPHVAKVYMNSLWRQPA
jgi:hypothetical protein